MFYRCVIAVGVAAGIAGPVPDGEAQDATRVVLAAFEGASKTLRVEAAEMQHGERPGGGQTLALTLPAEAPRVGKASVGVPAGTPWATARALSAWVKCMPASEPRVFRWQALDAAGVAIFQRRFEVGGTGLWTRMEWPLVAWRWGSVRCGRWGEVRRLEIRVERAGTRVELDDWALEAGEGATLGARSSAWLDALAFRGEGRWLREGGVGIGTDLGEERLATEELRRLHTRLQQAVRWMDRVGGDAVRPVRDGRRAALLLFREKQEYEQFFVRLGAAWNVSIAPPKAGGLALEDFAGSYWDPVKGVDRPVFLHETIHAIVAQRWRIAPRRTGADWMQEGAANYLQLCVYPDSMPRTGWKQWLGKPVGERGGPIPLVTLMSRNVALREYPQAAAIIAWLVAKHPDWMPGLIRDLADGAGPEKAFEARGSTLDAAEQEWKAWFDATLAPLTDADARHFPLPDEFSR